MSDTPPPLRVGDRERRAVDEQLQAAVGDGVLTLTEYDERSAVLWQARTRDELDHLVADLPDPARAAPAPLPPPARGGRTRRVVAVMSEDRMTGALAPGQQVQGWALMGKAVLDLRRDDLPRCVEVQVRSLMGEVEVMVPPGSAVHLSGFSLMGERKVQVGAGDGPDVHVDAVAVMGTVKVTVGDGTVLQTRPRPGVVPSPRTSPVAVRHPGPAHRQGGRMSQLLGRAKGAAVPVALLGALVLAGPDARAVFGDTTEFAAPGDDVQVSRLFGDVTVVVPDDSRVDVGGFGVFGNTEREGASPSGTGRVVDVRSYGAFGDTKIITRGEYDRQQAVDAEQERRERLEEQREDVEDERD